MSNHSSMDPIVLASATCIVVAICWMLASCVESCERTRRETHYSAVLLDLTRQLHRDGVTLVTPTPTPIEVKP